MTMPSGRRTIILSGRLVLLWLQSPFGVFPAPWKNAARDTQYAGRRNGCKAGAQPLPFTSVARRAPTISVIRFQNHFMALNRVFNDTLCARFCRSSRRKPKKKGAISADLKWPPAFPASPHADACGTAPSRTPTPESTWPIFLPHSISNKKFLFPV